MDAAHGLEEGVEGDLAGVGGVAGGSHIGETAAGWTADVQKVERLFSPAHQANASRGSIKAWC